MMNKLSISARIFRNADQEVVEYDGSPITWRVSAYAFVFNPQHELLIIKNKLEKLHDIVGGEIEIGETLEGALNREAMEEGGVNIKIDELLAAHQDWFYYKAGTFHQTLQLFYRAELVDQSGNPTDPDIEKVMWVKLIDLKKYALPMVVETIIAKGKL